MKSCPKCKSNMIIDIVYGYPSEEMSDAADSNKISLGEHSAKRVQALWGPMVSSGLSGEQVIGVATLNDVLQLSYTTYQPISGLLTAVEQAFKQSLAV